MGNHISERKVVDSQLAEFRVYIHRRNKFIHAWMKITPCDIVVQRSKQDIVVFPLQFLRRYGYTSAGVFFFESGRRCATGEGLHTFQSQHAENIFHVVQARIQDSANAARVASETRRRENALRIHPVQRHSSSQDAAAHFSSCDECFAQRPKRPNSLSSSSDKGLYAPCAVTHTQHGHATIIGNIIRSPSVSSAVSNASHKARSAPTTPTTTQVFPIQWDGGAGSTSFLCYANQSAAPPPPLPLRPEPQQRHPSGEQERRPLHYATVTAPLAHTERSSRSPSIASLTSYAVIDAQRTKALQAARSDLIRHTNLVSRSPRLDRPQPPY